MMMAQTCTMELEETSAQSLAWLKDSDITIENQREHLFKLKKLNKELTLEKLDLISKVSFHGFTYHLFLRLTNNNNIGAVHSIEA
jgi:hypothetical protein